MSQNNAQPKKQTSGGWISSGHPAVSDAAAQTLRAGGNAFDAIVTAGFCSSVAEPALTSLGGGGFLLARTEEGMNRVYDFFVENPGQNASASASYSRFTPVTISFDGADQDFNIGKGSVGVPGVLKGLLHIHEKHGRLPLEQVVAPAISLAEDGVLLTKIQAYTLVLLGPILTSTEMGAQLYAPKGQLLQYNERFFNRDMANFMRGLPDSASSFYEGAIAKETSREISSDGGLLTLDDLKNYRVVEREPLEISYRSHRILTNPAPSFGGPLLAVSLDLMSGQTPPVDPFLSPTHMARIAKILVDTEAKRESGVLNLNEDENDSVPRRKFTRGTTHVTIADDMGNIASMTTSNGEGSGHFASDTGIMLNNMLGEDDLHPEGFHSAPPGTRVASMMTPCVVLNPSGDAVLALGSGGSKRIRSAVLQVLTHVIDYGASLEDAVAAPRVHWEGGPLQVEGGLSPTVLKAISAAVESNEWPGKNLYFGGVHAVRPGKSAVGDLRRGGSAQIVTATPTQTET
jgi:gamma-glutamyltranspeptidase / glutathione hydrolase